MPQSGYGRLHSKAVHGRADARGFGKMDEGQQFRRLGHRLIIAEPQVSGGEFEHGKELCGVPFMARGKPSELLSCKSLDLI